MELSRKLLQYAEQDDYPFHMPGHKRQPLPGFDYSPYRIDITEIDGFDNLHHAQDILLEAQRRAAGLYGTLESYYLVNGSTCGILSAISAAVPRNGTILIARNCHKAVYQAAELRGLSVKYVYPQQETKYGLNGGICPEDVAGMLKENPDIKAVMLTSPTYDGVVSDIASIAEAVHAYGIPLLVDEAHGSHFSFHRSFPASALDKGADMVIHSLHKTMPCLTQTALLHRNSQRVSGDALRHFLGVYQTSSPSYVLMGSIDACMSYMEQKGTLRFEQHVKELRLLREKLGNLKRIQLVPLSLKGRNGIYDMDASKLILSVRHTKMNGKELALVLRQKYRLQMEMEASDYVLGMTSMMDTVEGYQRLWTALTEIDENVDKFFSGREQVGNAVHETICGIFLNGESQEIRVTANEQAMRIYEGAESLARPEALELCQGKISAEYVYLYPPGIPLLVPGERISKELIEKIRWFQNHRYDVQGTRDYTIQTIRIVDEKTGRK